MFKWKKTSEQRGTLMVEAIAMLGLIAIVTPTLYKKSAERLQEIQDINIASQARTMSSVIETFVRNNMSVFTDYTTSSGVSIYELCKDDGCSSQSDHLAHYLPKGYSSAIPYGFKPQDVKYFGEPRVFVVSEEGSIVFYVVYPKSQDLGKRRSIRLASLIGANGGVIESSTKIQGTGGAWELDEEMINNIAFPEDILSENSLVLTNNEPITTKFDDTEKFLYRIPALEEADAFHNTMVTDLYLGGNEENNTNQSANSYEFYSIFNVRKMTMNTKCTWSRINASGGVSTSVYPCDPDVADLYVGKPAGMFNDVPRASGVGGGERHYGSNNGAAWIYGNLSALSDRFRLYNTDYDSSGTSVERRGFDVLRFSHEDDIDSSTGAPVAGSGGNVFLATNEQNSAQVGMIDGTVRVVENFKGKESDTLRRALLVGGDNTSLNENEGRLITAYQWATSGNTQGRVNINDQDSTAVTRINSKGGEVYINGGDSSVTGDIFAHTYINPQGGELLAGEAGQWINAGEKDDSAHVDIFSSGVGLRFTVGGTETGSSYVWADSSMTSLRDGAIRTYTYNGTLGNVGGGELVGTGTNSYESGMGENALGSTLVNAAVVAAKYTDVLGSAYFGMKGATEAEIDSSAAYAYNRDNWRLTVAGSAWVDDLLFANDAWFNSTGVKELHAGFGRFNDYKEQPRKGWLNAYGDGVVIGGHDSSETGVGAVHPEKTRFYANDELVYMGDSRNAMVHLQDGTAAIGYAKDSSIIAPDAAPRMLNQVGADSSRAYAVGDELVEIYTSSNVADANVDIQQGAMIFEGHSWSSDAKDEHVYGNKVNTYAGQFAVHTRTFTNSAGEVVDTAESGVLYADKDDVLTRVVDFSVQDNEGHPVFKARPMVDLASSDANVMVDGSFHVTGNNVIHVSSDSSNAAGTSDDNKHAMFEVDPNFVKVMAMNTDSSYIDGRDDKLAMFMVNPRDVDGSSTVTRNAAGSFDFSNDPTENASVYVRRGAIELERNPDGSSSAADAGYGYIKANRFVSNAPISIPAARSMTEAEGHYDQYMVNPAYTSVMHDIKLTTRGGARLSDILPDYVLKGVYNVSNDWAEDTDKGRIKWSCGTGTDCKITQTAVWASPFLGLIPYASCPPGYRNMATIVPTSFQMGQAGDVVRPTSLAGFNAVGDAAGKWVVNPTPRHMKVLNDVAGGELFYPRLEEVDTVQVMTNVSTGATFDPELQFHSTAAGWFWGAGSIRHKNAVGLDVTDSKVEATPENVWHYYSSGTDYKVVAEPMYFQQNTFLKTSLDPQAKGWNGYMGFLYDLSKYSAAGLGNGLGQEGIRSNNNPEGYNDSSSPSPAFAFPGTWVWNLFPVPTNTLEGHATVYCYFDRRNFRNGDWSSLVDPIDQINSIRTIDSGTGLMNKTDDDYVKRLNDPSLKYHDPW